MQDSWKNLQTNTTQKEMEGFPVLKLSLLLNADVQKEQDSGFSIKTWDWANY